ncbi:hypothetical protein D6D04_04655 [Aureobasidium pullulans]|nr:hypothetical protein D6D04_04655 [Aureobasidium pullulans]
MHLELVKTLGCVVLRGDHVDNIARSSPPPTTSGPRHPYHVTILTKAESQQLNNSVDTPHQTSKIVERLLSTPQLLEDPIDLGVAIHGSTGFNVLFWPQGNNIRHQLGLSNKQFHITLTSDVYVGGPSFGRKIPYLLLVGDLFRHCLASAIETLWQKREFGTRL